VTQRSAARLLVVTLVLLVAGTAARARDAGAPRAWSFDRDAAEAPPAGFDFAQTGGGKPGRWLVRPDASAPSRPNVLAQLDGDPTDARFLVAVPRMTPVRDAVVSVRCKPVAGKVDQACGLVFRYRDERSYDLVRANPLESNIRFYQVRDGRRKQLASYEGSVTAGAWHELRVEAVGERVRVQWDGTQVLAARGPGAPVPGRVGVWTKADSVTSFDDLTVTAR
jgi:hypothetical protein